MELELKGIGEIGLEEVGEIELEEIGFVKRCTHQSSASS